jgi:hypothetical protein
LTLQTLREEGLQQLVGVWVGVQSLCGCNGMQQQKSFVPPTPTPTPTPTTAVERQQEEGAEEEEAAAVVEVMVKVGGTPRRRRCM